PSLLSCRPRGDPMSKSIGALILAAMPALTMFASGCGEDETAPRSVNPDLAAQGKDVFRFDTFGDETFWTGTLKMNEVIQSAVSPMAALSVGLKVDAEALPADVVAGIQNGTISLTTPATTLALLKLNAVVGVKGTVETVG